MSLHNFASLFVHFFRSEKIAGLLLIVCSVLSMILANSGIGHAYVEFWHMPLWGRTLEFWINDGLMTIFFFLIGLEIERELYKGELSDLRRSMLPVLAAIGGMLIPAVIHGALNYGTPAQSGFGIPMATDIAFSLAILSLLGDRVPLALKIFLTALAIIDDLGAIIVIAVFYTDDFSLSSFGMAMGIFGVLLILNRLRVHWAPVYIVAGVFMWFFMLQSGIHPTITGVLVAFALPFGDGSRRSPSIKMQHRLHYPTALLIVPLFALANTAVPVHLSLTKELLSPNSLGIILGLLIGKPLGVLIFSFLGIRTRICDLPFGLRIRDLLGAGILAGIGFTMSIFITMLAFSASATVNSSKLAIIVASTLAGVIGFFTLKGTLPEVKPLPRVDKDDNA